MNVPWVICAAVGVGSSAELDGDLRHRFAIGVDDQQLERGGLRLLVLCGCLVCGFFFGLSRHGVPGWRPEHDCRDQQRERGQRSAREPHRLGHRLAEQSRDAAPQLRWRTPTGGERRDVRWTHLSATAMWARAWALISATCTSAVA